MCVSGVYILFSKINLLTVCNQKHQYVDKIMLSMY